jgi:hypothetical protein
VEIWAGPTPVLSDNTYQTTYTVRPGILSPKTTYQWRVRAVDSAGNAGEWSTTWSFTTVTGLSAPILLSPPDNSTGVSLTPTLSWSQVAYASFYEIHLSRNPEFSQFDSFISTSTSFSLPQAKSLLPGMRYYWRVRAYDGGANEGSWSVVWCFTTTSTSKVEVSFTFYDTSGRPIAGTRVYISIDAFNWELWGVTDNRGTITDSDFRYPRRYVYFKPSGYVAKCRYIWSTGGTYYDVFSPEQEPSPPQPDKYAIVVTGTGTGQDVFEANGQRWKDYLERKGYTVIFLRGSLASANSVLATIDNVVKRASPTDTIVFVYVGHGDGGLLSSSDPKDAWLCLAGQTKLTDKQLQRAFANFMGKLFVFLGSCFSGGMDEVVTDDPNRGNRYLTTTCGPNALGLFVQDPNRPYDWTYFFLTEGLVLGRSGSQTMEGNFRWAKPRYVTTMRDGHQNLFRYYMQQFPGCSQKEEDWYPHEFDGDVYTDFML